MQNFYFFMNSTIKPFNSQLVREAVVMSVDQNALSKLDSGNLVPGCYFLPIGMIGHPTKPCPYGNPAVSDGGDDCQGEGAHREGGRHRSAGDRLQRGALSPARSS